MPHRRTSSRVFKNSSCLRKSQADAEARLWEVLRANRFEKVHFRRQHAIGSYVVDFCAPGRKLVIELDGGQHLEQETYDAERTTYLEAKGYRVLRFWNHEVMKNLEDVLKTIFDAVMDDPS